MARESTIKVVSFNILGLGAVGVGLFMNYVQPVFRNDISHLTYVIAATTLAIVILSTYNCFRPQKWIREFSRFEESNVRILGLAGTLVGLLFLTDVISSAGSATTGSSSEILAATLKGFTQGLRLMFNPTLVGVISWFWIRHLVYFTRGDR